MGLEDAIPELVASDVLLTSASGTHGPSERGWCDPLDFGDERLAAKIAERLKVPVLLAAANEPPAREDASLDRISDSYCDNLSMASALSRRDIAFHFAGLFFPGEAEFLDEEKAFAHAWHYVGLGTLCPRES